MAKRMAVTNVGCECPFRQILAQSRIQYPQLFSVLDLFSWQRNTNDGIRILNGKPKSGATASWINSVSLYQQYATMHGGNPPPPGNDVYPYCTFSYSPQTSQHSFSDAIWIKRYNGIPNGDYILWNTTTSSWTFHRCSSSGCYVKAVCSKPY